MKTTLDRTGCIPNGMRFAQSNDCNSDCLPPQHPARVRTRCQHPVLC